MLEVGGEGLRWATFVGLELRIPEGQFGAGMIVPDIVPFDMKLLLLTTCLCKFSESPSRIAVGISLEAVSE